MSSPRVAYVCADPGIPVFGTKGASVHIQELVRAWRARGAHVEIFAVRRGDDVPQDLADVPVHVVKVGGSGLAPAERERAQQHAAAELARQVCSFAPDYVHERYSLFSEVLPVVRRQTRAATILEVNAPLIDEQRVHRVLIHEPEAQDALIAQVNAADVVACVSDPVADWVRERVPGAPHASVIVVPNGVDTDRIQPVTPDLSGDPIVVFVGTLKPWHGVEDLLTAAWLTRTIGAEVAVGSVDPGEHSERADDPGWPDVRWRIRLIGDGPQRAALEAQADEDGLDVEFVGAVPPEQVPAALDGALVAVAPYPDSGDHYFSPLKVFEYGAAGLPVVASRIGQIPRIVEGGRTGLLVPPGDPLALAEAIDALVADPVLAQRMGAAARARMTAGHTWGHVLEATLAPLSERSGTSLWPAGPVWEGVPRG